MPHGFVAFRFVRIELLQLKVAAPDQG